MNEEEKTELAQLHHRIAELEKLEAERKQAENMAHTQRNLALALSAVPGLDEGLRLCFEATLHVSGMDCGGIYFIDGASGALDLAFHKGLTPDFARCVSHYDADSANVQLVMTGQPIYTEHLQLGVPLDASERHEGLRAMAVIPIYQEDRVIGCLNVASHTLDEVPVFARDALETIVAQIGNSIGRLKAEEALLNALKKREELEGIINYSPAIVFLWCAAEGWPVEFVSDNIQQWGYTPEDFYSGEVPYAGIIYPSDLERVASEVDHYSQEGRNEFVQEYRVITKGGEVRWLDDRTWIRRDARGVITHYQGIVLDITERKQAVEDRTRFLKELESKNREMQQFTYTVSHDLRSPLVTIQGFAGMLRKDLEHDAKEKAVTDLEYIEKAATKMDTLLSDTLKLSRIGRMVNLPETIPFGAIVQGALEQTAGGLQAHHIEVTIAEDFPTVHVDRMRIEELLVNLITNSIRYRGENPHPKIEIGYRKANGETTLFVRDNGIGIEKSQADKVFDLFYQVDRSGGGTGAGLAIVKRIVEVHGGRIWIESELGKGCTICFTLPFQ